VADVVAAGDRGRRGRWLLCYEAQSGHGAAVRGVGGFHLSGDTETKELHNSRVAHLDVGGLDVAMDNGLAM
jgi:hypothetical protein